MKYKLLAIIALTSMYMQAISENLDTTKIENKKINYRFTSDANNLYLNIKTSDRDNIMSMLRSGISVYFDTKGKKKKNVYVRYPINSGKRKERGGGQSDQKGPQLMDVISEMSKKAEYGHFKNKQQFHIDLNTQDIQLGFKFNKEERALEYHLKVPKTQIIADKELDLSKLSVGVVIGEKNRELQVGSQQRSSGGRGQRGGGGPPGGGPGQQRGGNGAQQSGRPSLTSINFWFDALDKK